MCRSQIADSDHIRTLIRDEFVYSAQATAALNTGEFRISESRATTSRQYARVYRMRHGMSLARNVGDPAQLQAMDELATRLWAAEDSPCVLWIMDTGDHEYIFFDVAGAEPAGILFFDRNKLPGERYCPSCDSVFRSRTPEFACPNCGQRSKPNTWKYRGT